MYKNPIETKYKANRGHQLCSQKNEHKRSCFTRRRLPQSLSSHRRSRSCCLPCHSELGKMNSRDGEDKQHECVVVVASNDACTAHRRHNSCWTLSPSLIHGLCCTEVQRRRGAGSSRYLGVGLAMRPSPASRRRKRTHHRCVMFFWDRERPMLVKVEWAAKC
jgi:hypothetical protein